MSKDIDLYFGYVSNSMDSYLNNEDILIIDECHNNVNAVTYCRRIFRSEKSTVRRATSQENINFPMLLKLSQRYYAANRNNFI